MKRTLVLSALVALTLSACGQTGDRTIKIGMIAPLTGDLASAGADISGAARMAVDELNATGGINGKMIELIVEDGRCNAADATNAAQKLVNADKVVAIVGDVCSSGTLAMAPIVEAAKIVALSPTSSSPDVTMAGDYVFRNYPSDGLKGKALGAYLQKAGFKKIAMISENTDFCQGLAKAVKNDAPHSLQVVFDEQVDPGTKDFRSLFTRLKEKDFDVFFANAQSDTTVAEMAKQMRALGMKQQIVGSDTADSATLGQLAKEAVEGLKPLSVPGLDDTNPKGATFSKAFRDKYGEPKFGLFFAALAYDATKVLAQQIAAVGTGEALKNSLYTMPPYAGVAGTFSFDKNGDVVGIPFAMKEFKDGKLVQSELIPL